MLSEEEQEKDMLNDIDYVWKCYRDRLESGKSSVRELNTVIKALKHAHRYFNELDDNDDVIEPGAKK